MFLNMLTWNSLNNGLLRHFGSKSSTIYLIIQVHVHIFDMLTLMSLLLLGCQLPWFDPLMQIIESDNVTITWYTNNLVIDIERDTNKL